MPSAIARPCGQFGPALTNHVVDAMRSITSRGELIGLMEAITREMNFRYYALIHHDDLRSFPPDLVDLKEYPAAISARLIDSQCYRRDPVIRGCIFADGAFMWSDLPALIQFNRYDRASFERGQREGLNEGITVPYVRLGDQRHMFTQWLLPSARIDVWCPASSVHDLISTGSCATWRAAESGMPNRNC